MDDTHSGGGMTMKCPHCGFDNPEGQMSCGGCARSLDEALQETRGLGRCPYCGFDNPRGKRFCPDCGSMIPRTPRKTASADEGEKRMD